MRCSDGVRGFTTFAVPAGAVTAFVSEYHITGARSIWYCLAAHLHFWSVRLLEQICTTKQESMKIMKTSKREVVSTRAHIPRSKLIHTAIPDMTKLSCLCRVRFGSVNWVGPTARQVRSVSGLCRSASGGAVRPRSATAGRTPTQNALVRRSIHTATPDKTKQSCLCRVRRGGVN